MAENTIVTGILMDETTTISFVEVCDVCRIPESVLLEMIEHGLVHKQALPAQNTVFDRKILARIQSACRLQQDLEINTPGVLLALELLDELEKLRNELRVLQRHVMRD